MSVDLGTRVGDDIGVTSWKNGCIIGSKKLVRFVVVVFRMIYDIQ